MSQRSHATALPSSESQLTAVVKFLKDQQTGHGLIDIPDELSRPLSEAIVAHTKVNSASKIFPTRDVECITHALSEGDRNICDRLNAASMSLILEILLKSAQSNAREIGLCLMIASLHRSEGGASSDGPPIPADLTATARRRKQDVGVRFLVPLIESFIEKSNHVRFRRWVGLLVLELLRDCEQNQNQLDLVVANDIRTALGHTIFNHKSQVLKQISAAIIHQLVASGSNADQYWPIELSEATLKCFPTAPLHHSQWTEEFEAFLDHLHEHGLLKEVDSETYFPIALSTEQQTFFDGKIKMTLTIYEDLNIVIPSSATSPAQYIDVSLGNIKCIEYTFNDESSGNSTKSTEVPSVVKLQLDAKGETTYSLNALPQLAEALYIEFEDEDSAKFAVQYIKEEMTTLSTLRANVKRKVSVVSNALSVDEIPSKSDLPEQVAPPSLKHDSSKKEQLNFSEGRLGSGRQRASALKASSNAILSQPDCNVSINSQLGPNNENNSTTYTEDSVARMAVNAAIARASGFVTTKHTWNPSRWVNRPMLVEHEIGFEEPPVTLKNPEEDASATITFPHTPTRPSQSKPVEEENLYELSPAGQVMYQKRMQHIPTSGKTEAAEDLSGSSVENAEPYINMENQTEAGSRVGYARLTEVTKNFGPEPSRRLIPSKRKLKDVLRDQHGSESKVEASLKKTDLKHRGVTFQSDEPPEAKLSSSSPNYLHGNNAKRPATTTKHYGKQKRPQITSDIVQNEAEDDVYAIPQSQEPLPVSKKPRKKQQQRNTKARAAKRRPPIKATKAKLAIAPAPVAKKKPIKKLQKGLPPKDPSVLESDTSKTKGLQQTLKGGLIRKEEHHPSQTLPISSSYQGAAHGEQPAIKEKTHGAMVTSKELHTRPEPSKPLRPTRSAAVKANRRITKMDYGDPPEESALEVFGSNDHTTTDHPDPKIPVNGQNPESNSVAKDAREKNNQEKSNIELLQPRHRHPRDTRSDSLLAENEDGIRLNEALPDDESSSTEHPARIDTGHRNASPVTIAGENYLRAIKAPDPHSAGADGKPEEIEWLARSELKISNNHGGRNDAFLDFVDVDNDTIDPALLQIHTIEEHSGVDGAIPHTPKIPPEEASKTYKAPIARMETPSLSDKKPALDQVRFQAAEYGDQSQLDLNEPAGKKSKKSDAKDQRSTADKFEEALANVGESADPHVKRDETSRATPQEVPGHARHRRGPVKAKPLTPSVLNPGSRHRVEDQPYKSQRRGSTQSVHAMPVVSKQPRSHKPDQQSRDQAAQTDPEKIINQTQTLLHPIESPSIGYPETTGRAQQTSNDKNSLSPPSVRVTKTEESKPIRIPTEVPKDYPHDSSTRADPESHSIRSTTTVNKRSARDDFTQVATKKSRPSLSKPEASVAADTHTRMQSNQVLDDGRSVMLVDDHAVRKTPIISFGKHGPRNQGVPLPINSTQTQHQIQGKPSAIFNRTTRQPSLFQSKRKREESSQASVPNTPRRKRQKSITVDSSTKDSIGLDITESASPFDADISPNKGSQGTRTNEYGSPVLITTFPKAATTPFNVFRDAPKKSVDGEVPSYVLDSEIDETREQKEGERPDVGLLVHSSDTADRVIENTPVRRNADILLDHDGFKKSKTLPAVVAHRIAPGGRFVNVHTEDVVQAEKSLQDPFNGMGSQGSGTFMDRLQAHISVPMRQPSKTEAGDHNRKRPKGTAAPVIQDCDPDQTLVENNDMQPYSNLIFGESTTTSSRTSNTTKDSGPSSGLSELDRDPETEWRTALKPHQRNTLDVLNSITNRLVRHLVDKEIAVKDISRDYLQRGIRLIDALEASRNNDLAQSKEEIDRAKAVLTKELKQTTDWIDQENQRLSHYSVATAVKQHKAKQEFLDVLLQESIRSVKK